MLLRRLVLRQFRNYNEACVDFGAGLNILTGDNAQGKTSLLEGIFLCVSARSFRTQQTRDLIREGESFFAVEAHFKKVGVDQRLFYSFDGSNKRVEYNSTPFRSLAQVLGVLPGVLMVPQDDNLIKGGPRSRRHYLDLQLAQVDAHYLHQLVRYQKAMRQRNHLLRIRDTSTISLWETEMARAAAYIVAQRHAATCDLSARATARYSRLTEQHEPLSLRYRSPAPASDTPEEIETYYMRKYIEGREREIAQKHTLYGPHTEDLAIEISGRDCKHFASEGQQRCAVAAMRLAEWERLHALIDGKPLLIVDDFALGMDATRRNLLLQQLAELGQVFLSTAQDPASIVGDGVDATLFHVQHGTINLS